MKFPPEKIFIVFEKELVLGTFLDVEAATRLIHDRMKSFPEAKYNLVKYAKGWEIRKRAIAGYPSE